MEPEVKFPRHLFSKGGKYKWGKDLTYSKTYVKDEKEYKAALEAGYVDSFHDALFGKEKTSALQQTEENEEDF